MTNYFSANPQTTAVNPGFITTTLAVSNFGSATTIQNAVAAPNDPEFPPAIIEPGNSGHGTQIIGLDTAIVSVAWATRNQLVAAQTASINEQATVQWYDISTAVSTTASLIQSGDQAPGPGIYTYAPAIDISPVNFDIGMTYGQTSTIQNPSVYVTGRTLSDPAGKMEAATLAIAGQLPLGSPANVPPIPFDMSDTGPNNSPQPAANPLTPPFPTGNPQSEQHGNRRSRRRHRSQHVFQRHRDADVDVRLGVHRGSGRSHAHHPAAAQRHSYERPVRRHRHHRRHHVGIGPRVRFPGNRRRHHSDTHGGELFSGQRAGTHFQFRRPGHLVLRSHLEFQQHRPAIPRRRARQPGRGSPQRRRQSVAVRAPKQIQVYKAINAAGQIPVGATPLATLNLQEASGSPWIRGADFHADPGCQRPVPGFLRIRVEFHGHRSGVIDGGANPKPGTWGTVGLSEVQFFKNPPPGNRVGNSSLQVDPINQNTFVAANQYGKNLIPPPPVENFGTWIPMFRAWPRVALTRNACSPLSLGPEPRSPFNCGTYAVTNNGSTITASNNQLAVMIVLLDKAASVIATGAGGHAGRSDLYEIPINGTFSTAETLRFTINLLDPLRIPLPTAVARNSIFFI